MEFQIVDSMQQWLQHEFCWNLDLCMFSWLSVASSDHFVTPAKSSKLEANDMLSFHLFWFRLGQG